MKNKKEIEEWKNRLNNSQITGHISGRHLIGIDDGDDTGYGDSEFMYLDEWIDLRIQSEKDKWKARVLEIIGEDEETSTVLYGASQAFIHRNQLRQQLREKVEKL